MLKKLTFFLLTSLISGLFLLLTSVSFVPQVQAADSQAGGGNSGVTIPLTSYFTLQDGTPVADRFNTPASMLNLIIRIVFIAAGLILFFMVVVAGFGMISGDPKNAEKSKGTITNAVLGFVIMFAAYWIMQIIKLVTGADIGI